VWRSAAASHPPAIYAWRRHAVIAVAKPGRFHGLAHTPAAVTLRGQSQKSVEARRAAAARHPLLLLSHPPAKAAAAEDAL